jgi:hypothetical protein
VYCSSICCCNSILLLTIKTTCCKWFPFSWRHVSHITNTLLVAHLSSAGQVFRRYFPNTFFQYTFCATIIPYTLPFNIPHKKTQKCSYPLKGEAKIPCLLFCRHKKTQRTAGCMSTNSVKFFLINRMSSTCSVPVRNVTCSSKACLQICFLAWSKFPLNLLYQFLLYGILLMYYTKPQVTPINSPCRLQVTRKQLTASPPNDVGANQWVSSMFHKKASQREMTGHGCQITKYPYL